MGVGYGCCNQSKQILDSTQITNKDIENDCEKNVGILF